MIVFVLTPEHAYTVGRMAGGQTGLNIEVATYDEVLSRSEFRRATYVFTDTDRLPHWRVRQAARLYRALREAGLRVINDPARVPSRYGLLRKLHAMGINGFNAYRIEEDAAPTRWPVFLRAEGDHEAPLSDLLNTPAEVEAAVEAALAAGAPLSSLLVVEYAAEPAAPGLFRKLSVYRFGDVYLPSLCVHQDHWLVKYGTNGIATPELYEDEQRILRDNPYEAAMRPVFEAAGIEYGRVDFGLVGGAPQIYEINTNPSIGFGDDHPSPIRVQSYALFKDLFFKALASLDSPG